jgi:tetratricopeptide (TPR) repeat protein
MKSKTPSLLILVLVLALIIGGVYYFETYVIGGFPSGSYSQTNSVYSALKNGNTFFNLGESLVAQGNLSGAQAAYQEALPTASDQYQAGVIELRLAIIQWTTDPVGSIVPLEAIATNPNYAYSTRAYALQYIAQAYHAPVVPLSATQVQQLVTTTFATSTFSVMLVNGDLPLAYRQIYDAADELYPLPLSEAMSAQWYGNQINNSIVLHMSSSTLANNVAAANADLSAMTSAIQTESVDPSLNIFTAEALEIKANVIRDLWSGASIGTIDQIAAAYKAALDAFGTVANVGTNDGFGRYNYAVFLSTAYGASQAAQVQSILAPIYSNPAYATSPLGIFLAGLIDNKASLRANAVAVASIDPKFKSYLISLGWPASDFN